MSYIRASESPEGLYIFCGGEVFHMPVDLFHKALEAWIKNNDDEDVIHIDAATHLERIGLDWRLHFGEHRLHCSYATMYYLAHSNRHRWKSRMWDRLDRFLRS